MRRRAWVALALGLALVPLGAQTRAGDALSDRQATAETRALATVLGAQAGSRILFGQQDATAYGVGWVADPGDALDSDLTRVSGRLPGLIGFDLGDLETVTDPNRNLRRVRLINGVTVATLVSQVTEAWNRGIVTQLVWHCRNLVTGGDAWDTSDRRAVARVLPGGDRHGALVAALDQVSRVLDLLKDPQGRPIPLVFRPWHEHNGGWFWWGTRGASVAEFRELYRFTLSYLRETRGQHQLISVYSSDAVATPEALLEHYPGGDVVDLIGIDDYRNAGVDGSVASFRASIEVLAEAGRRVGKPIALTETGQENLRLARWYTERLLPVLASAVEARLWYVLVWRNGGPEHFYLPYPGQASADDFRRFAEAPVLGWAPGATLVP